MAQPVQVTTGLPSGDYCIIDNSAAGNTVPTAPGGPVNGLQGFDTTWPGANSQGANPILSGAGNGSIPDFVDDQAVIIRNSVTGITVLLLNPS